MDANTRFLLEQLNEAKKEIREDIRALSEELREDIKQLQSFRQRLMGMSAIAGVLTAGAVEFVVQILKH